MSQRQNKPCFEAIADKLIFVNKIQQSKVLGLAFMSLRDDLSISNIHFLKV